MSTQTSPAMKTIHDRSEALHHPLPDALARRLESVEAGAWGSVYRAAREEDVATCGIQVSTVGTATVLTAAHVDVLAFNRTLGLGLDAPAHADDLDTIIERYEAADVPRFFVQVSPAAQPAALFDELQRRGFQHYNNWVKLYRDVAPPPDVTTDLRIERAGPALAAPFADLLAPAFDWPENVQPWLTRLVGRPGWRHYAAFDGDVPAAMGALYATGEYGYLGPAATHPDHRRRGAQSALIARRIRDARSLGCRYLVTETAEDRPDHPAPSYRNLRRLGFEVAYVRPNYLYAKQSPSSLS